MSIKIEIGLLLTTVVIALGVFAIKQPFATEGSTDRNNRFASADYAAFDRHFTFEGDVCKVGLKKRGLCFTASPLQPYIAKDQYLPTSVPLLAAEFPIIAALPVKTEAQQLLRYGTVLALINEDSRMIEDVLHIDADSFAAATQPADTFAAKDNIPAG